MILHPNVFYLQSLPRPCCASRALKSTGRQGRAARAFLAGPTAQVLPFLQPLSSSPAGLLVALSILCAIRLERSRSERQWQARRQTDLMEEWASLFQEQQVRQQQDELAQAAAAKRLQEAEQEAAVQERLRLQEQQILQEVLKRDQQASKAKQAADHAAFQAREDAMQAEMSQRAEAVRQARAAKAEQRRLEQEQQRMEAERLGLEREREEQQLAAARRAQEEEARQQAAAAKRALDRLRVRYALKVYGDVSIGPAAQAQASSSLDLTVSLTSSAGGTPSTNAVSFSTAEDITDGGAVQASVSATASVSQQYESTAQLQQMSSQGPLSIMQEPELRHWIRQIRCRAAAAVAQCAQSLLQSPGVQRAPQSRKFEVRTERAVLPEGNEQRTDAQLSKAVSLLTDGDVTAARALLSNIMADEEELTAQTTSAPVPRHLGETLALVYFLDTALQEGASKAEESARSLLRSCLQHAPKDSLPPLAELVVPVLPAEHPLAAELQQLADANTSEAARRRRRERQQLREAQHAAAILEEEYPDESERKAATAAAREAATPVPERVWALRNVGASLSLGGASERARARQMLEKAVTLKQEWLDDPRHPGLLPELQALRQLLERQPEWEGDARGVCSLQMSLLSAVVERYVQQGDVVSAVILLEAAVRESEQVLAVASSSVKGMSQRAEQLLAALTQDQRQQVSAARRQGGTLQSLFSAFEEDLAARQLAASATKKDLWSNNSTQLLPKLS